MKQDVNFDEQAVPGRQQTSSLRGPVTETIVQQFSMPVEYPVVFTHGLFDPGNSALCDVVRRYEPDKRHRLFVVLDDGVAQAIPDLTTRLAAYAAAHESHLELLTVELVQGGEAVKNQADHVDNLLERMLALAVDRHSYVMAIGGGAVLDLVGYAAAICHRGIRLLRVPTTVLAQNDSGVGVKNGVNALGVKNFVGTFAPPFAVLNDFAFIESLQHRDKIAGMAEAVKVALIRDGAFFTWLEANAKDLARFEPQAMAYMIRRCAELHLRHIGTGGDPFEQGSARPLDYGHWSAHKLEGLSNHDLRHGEAVAIGMAMDAHYAVLMDMLSEIEGQRICRLLETLGFRLWHDTLEMTAENGEVAVMDGLREFQEHLGGELTITLIAAIGQGVEVHHIDAVTMLAARDWLRERSATP
ncbi:MAG: 3-dehydroquinate synthase [Rhodospirillaceae bacterium]|jgi:3-dehydroquinate synthase|nr:3-dehydroquinate synthase [Rhodospirillaceae bacterium]MBT5081646.1 3-dehydroquinate synthase [Rhodospirillaceae bacterium]MBT5524838.1 3-dehydroquinate synthase [Rhodospirillaceae bacterium]MBT5881121.1 3-dehydroquinate synthase [Rhodospirillaceae bacterium]MBT6589406.1 3-dehydroquinate synthase [Rhodospirillaceae bacterium]